MNNLRWLPVVLVFVGALLLSACGASVEEEDWPGSAGPEISSISGDAGNAREYLDALANEIGSRTPGSSEEAQAAAYIRSQFESFGYEVAVQTFDFTTEDDENLSSANVIAFKEGLSEQVIVVGAHYDSPWDDAPDGADDNASGVAVLLAAAEQVADVKTPYSIQFIAFGAEENDLDGSTYYVDQLSAAELDNLVAMINLDSLIAGDYAYMYGEGDLFDWLVNAADEAGYQLDARGVEELVNEDGSPCDCADYAAFEAAGIPFAYFEATNWGLGDQDGMTQVDPQYGRDGEIRHTSYDNIDYIDETFPGRIDEHLELFVTLLTAALMRFE